MGVAGAARAWSASSASPSSLGAIGLILPAATKIKPSLTPLAALGLLTIMILAMAFHLSRGEVQATPVNIVLGGLAAFVAWGRTKRAPIR